jgi:hydroxymethylpyrimidine pyrophosphatase-like HAD family hydrolase
MLLADLDGTVLDGAGRVVPATGAALARLKAAGWHVVLATGRCWRSARPVAEALGGAADTAICLNGALVKRASDGATLAQAPILHAVVRRLVEIAAAEGQSPLVHVDAEEATGCDALLVPCGNGISPETQRYLDFSQGAWRRLEPHEAADIVGRVLEVSVWAPEAALERVRRAVDAALDGRVRTLVIHAPNLALRVFEAFAPQVTKWSAALDLAARWAVEPRDIVAVGDDVNDLEMIRGAGLGVAKGTASPLVQAAADRVVASSDGGGLVSLVDALLQ